jgi:capsular polysaccharide biosynthesis protein
MGLQSLPKYMSAIFSGLGIDLQRIVLCNEPLQVDHLETTDPVYQIRGHVNASVRALYKMQAALPSSGRIIYLSRTKLVDRRSIAGEQEFEDALVREHGVTIVHPEQLTIQEQLRCMASADTIIACAGSALHSLIFVEGARRVVILTPTARDALNYWLCDELFDSVTSYVACASSFGPSRTWQIDLGAALAALAHELNH